MAGTAISTVGASRRFLDDRFGDDVPKPLAGHELSELRDAPHQPATESVLYYMRKAQIDSFPQSPNATGGRLAEAPAVAAEDTAQAAGVRAPFHHRAIAAGAGSLVFHGLLFATVLIIFANLPSVPEEDAGEAMQVVMFGDSDADQVAAGEEQDTPPEDVVAEAVEPETIMAQPPETLQAEPLPSEPVQSESVPAAEEVDRISPDTAIAIEPDVLTSQGPAETSVAQPMAPETVQPIVPEQAQSSEAVSSEDIASEPVEPEPPQAIKPPKLADRPKSVEKPKPPKPVQSKRQQPASGSRGENEQDARKGLEDGRDEGRSDRSAASVGKGQGNGAAAASSYQSKVSARIKRYASRTRYKVDGLANPLFQITIGRDGALNRLSLLRGSGDPEVDEDIMQKIRRASPFPSFPEDLTRPSVTYSVPIVLD